MEDTKIVNLYWARNEKAIEESDRKYGRLLRHLSYSLLSSEQDAEECVNDTYLDAWGCMPTQRPTYLGAFLSKIVRRISIDRYRSAHRAKRGGGGLVLEELDECIPSEGGVEEECENRRLSEAINRFLAGLETEKRVIFLRRYFYSAPISEIAATMNINESKVKVVLFRLRDQLHRKLEEEELL